jgi:hypothetical protein
MECGARQLGAAPAMRRRPADSTSGAPEAAAYARVARANLLRLQGKHREADELLGGAERSELRAPSAVVWPRLVAWALPPAVLALFILSLLLTPEGLPSATEGAALVRPRPQPATARAALPASRWRRERTLWETASSWASVSFPGGRSSELAGLWVDPVSNTVRIRLAVPPSTANERDESSYHDRLLRVALRVAHAAVQIDPDLQTVHTEWFRAGADGAIEPLETADLTRAAAAGNPEMPVGESLRALFAETHDSQRTGPDSAP